MMALLSNGLLLMVIGMGTVFLFLSIMVGCIILSSKVTARFAHLLPEKEKPRRKKPPAPTPKASAPDDGVLLAVVTTAIHTYRQEHR